MAVTNDAGSHIPPIPTPDTSPHLSAAAATCWSRYITTLYPLMYPHSLIRKITKKKRLAQINHPVLGV